MAFQIKALIRSGDIDTIYSRIDRLRHVAAEDVIRFDDNFKIVAHVLHVQREEHVESMYMVSNDRDIYDDLFHGEGEPTRNHHVVLLRDVKNGKPFVLTTSNREESQTLFYKEKTCFMGALVVIVAPLLDGTYAGLTRFRARDSLVIARQPYKHVLQDIMSDAAIVGPFAPFLYIGKVNLFRAGVEYLCTNEACDGDHGELHCWGLPYGYSDNHLKERMGLKAVVDMQGHDAELRSRKALRYFMKDEALTEDIVCHHLRTLRKTVDLIINSNVKFLCIGMVKPGRPGDEVEYSDEEMGPFVVKTKTQTFLSTFELYEGEISDDQKYSADTPRAKIVHGPSSLYHSLNL